MSSVICVIIRNTKRKDKEPHRGGPNILAQRNKKVKRFLENFLKNFLKNNCGDFVKRSWQARIKRYN